ncbi:MAG TPA: hypothetical protein VGG31_01770 [Candidatus Dormibacteraeota bacterium]
MSAASMTGAVAYADLGGGVVPGHTVSTSVSGFAGLSDQNSDTFISLSVVSGQLSFRARGGGITRQDGTEVQISASTIDNLFGFGCWLTPASVVTVNQDLSATLTFDSSAPGVTPCPGQPVAPGLSAAPAMTNINTAQGLRAPIVISAQWTPSYSLDERHVVADTTCNVSVLTASGPRVQSFRATDNQDTKDQSSAAVATVTNLTLQGFDPTTGQVIVEVPLTGTFDTTHGFADVATVTDNLVVNGPTAGTCGPFGS